MKNENVAQKVIWFLNHLKDEGVEILDTTKKESKNDFQIDLKNSMGYICTGCIYF